MRDALGNVNAKVYDAGGNVVEERHADGGRITHRYSAFGDRTVEIDAVGNDAADGSLQRDEHTTNFKYDKLGRVVEVSRGPVNVYGMTQDSQSAQLQLSGPAHRRTTEQFTYDQAGRKLRAQDGDGRITRYTYDAAGRVIATKQPLETLGTVVYDAFGHRAAEIDPNGRWSTWQADYFGRVTQHVNLGGQTVAYGYDHAGQLIGQVSAGGQATTQQNLTFHYDAAGQLVGIDDVALNKTTTYAYDLSGHRVLERTVQAGIVQQDNHLAYDASGRLRDVSDGREPSASTTTRTATAGRSRRT